MLKNITTANNMIHIKPIILDEEVVTRSESGEQIINIMPQAQEWYEIVEAGEGVVHTHLLAKLFNVEAIKDGEETHYFVDLANVLAFADYEHNTQDN